MKVLLGLVFTLAVASAKLTYDMDQFKKDVLEDATEYSTILQNLTDLLGVMVSKTEELKLSAANEDMPGYIKDISAKIKEAKKNGEATLQPLLDIRAAIRQIYQHTESLDKRSDVLRQQWVGWMDEYTQNDKSLWDKVDDVQNAEVIPSPHPCYEEIFVDDSEIPADCESYSPRTKYHYFTDQDETDVYLSFGPYGRCLLEENTRYLLLEENYDFQRWVVDCFTSKGACIPYTFEGQIMLKYSGYGDYFDDLDRDELPVEESCTGEGWVNFKINQETLDFTDCVQGGGQYVYGRRSNMRALCLEKLGCIGSRAPDYRPHRIFKKKDSCINQN